jgi:hypothetical protein
MPIKSLTAIPPDETPVYLRGHIEGRGLLYPRHLGLPDEVFLLTRTPEEARAVEDRNDPAIAALKADRQRYVLDNGVVQEAELPDINAALEREVLSQAGVTARSEKDA